MKYEYAEQIETAQTRPDIGYAPILVQQNHYDAWGMKLPLFISDGKDPYKGLPEDRFKFLKHELVEGVGLYDLEARLYDPTLGRFAQIDPMPDDGGQESLTPYQYAWNNPILRSDPDGKCPKEPCIDFAGIVKNTVKDLAVSAFNTASQSNFLDNILLGGDVRAERTDKGDITIGIRPNATNLGQFGKNNLSDAFDGVNTLSTVYGGGTAKAALAGTGMLFAKTGAKTALVNSIVQKAKGGVYALTDAEGIIRRTGRATDLKVRKSQHALDKAQTGTKGLNFEIVHSTDDYAEQRGLEYLLFEDSKATATSGNGGLNKIKAISDKNLKSDKGQKYLKAAEEFLKKQ